MSYWFAARLAANVGRDLRTIVYDHSLKLSAADFNRFGAGSMVTRALSDANVVQQTLLMCFTMMGPVPVTSVVAIMLAFGIDPAMGWVLFVVVVICLTISLVAVAKSAPIFLVMQGFVDRMNVRLREVITGIRPIRAFGKDADEREPRHPREPRLCRHRLDDVLLDERRRVPDFLVRHGPRGRPRHAGRIHQRRD